MSVRRRIVMAAAILACAGSGRSLAADLPPGVYSSAPAAMAGGTGISPGSCGSGTVGVSRYTAGFRGVPSCNTAACETPRFHSRQKEPYAVNLCPGACFGYFQTQWRSWDEACPIPYSAPAVGVPVSPIPHVPPSSDRPPQDPKMNGDGVPSPRPVDPKMGMPVPPPGGELPQIPPYPGPGGR